MTGALSVCPTFTEVMDGPEILLLIEEVSTITRIPSPTLYRWRSSGLSGGSNPGPPSFNLGQRVVFSSHALRDWIKQNQENGAG